MRSKNIAFVKAGSFSKINDSVLQILQEQFPEYEVNVIDVYQLVLSNKLLLCKNFYYALKEYGFRQMLQSKKKFIWYFFSSSYLFHHIKALIAKHILPEKYVFSLQTQSFYDASVIGVPHFVYTDDTELSNLYYPYFNINELLPKSRTDLEATVYQNATANFTLSSNIRRSIIEQYGCEAEKVVRIYAGSNVKVSSTANKQRDYQNQNILFVGVDWERKGGPALAEAFNVVLKTYPQAQLTIVGCSPNLDVPNCHVVGLIPLEEVGKYYESAAIFCLPTTFEPFGIVFVEALMYKLPVIGTNISAIPDFITEGENGYLVQPNNVEQIAQALMSLLGDPSKCQTFGEEGYRLVIERYSWDKVGSRIKQIIEPIIHLQRNSVSPKNHLLSNQIY